MIFTTFRSRALFLITVLVLVTALSIAVFQQLQLESHILETELNHARNLLKMATVHIENQYESYLFHKNSLLEERKNDLKNLIDLGFNLIESEYKNIASEGITEEEAQRRAIALIKTLRYSEETGYFWINTAEAPEAKMIMHPTMPHLDGKYLDKSDPLFNAARGGNFNLFSAFVEVCNKYGEGYVDYLWPKPVAGGLTESQSKISYVKLFKPWNWIIGTGLYIDDIEKDSQNRLAAILKELRKAFSKIRIAENSYLFMFNSRYDMLVHPLYEGKNLIDMKNPVTEVRILDEMMAAARSKSQMMSYHWNKPTDARPGFIYFKRAFIQHFAPLDWYIVASIYEDELMEPLHELRWKLMFLVFIMLSISLMLAALLIKNLSQPLQQLAEIAKKIEGGGLNAAEVPIIGTLETRQLGHCLQEMLVSIRNSLSEKEELLSTIKNDEERFRATLNSIADAVISTDIQGRIIGMNPMAENLTGYNNESVIGRPLEEVYKIFSSETHSQASSPVQKILNSNFRASAVEKLLLRNKTGEEFHISQTGSIIRNSKNELKGVVIVFRNITDDYIYQQKLKEAEWKFYALFEHGPLGVAYHKMIYDQYGRPYDYYFIDANTNYRELTGVDPRGKTVRNAFPGIEKDSFDWIGTFGKVAKTGESVRFQQHLQANNRWYDCVAFQYKPDHFVAAFFEITEQRKLEQQLRQAQKMDAIGQLAGGIAHDFNNVLGGILGAAELLGMEISENSNASRYLALIQDSSSRASDLIRKLLAFGRQNNLVSTPVDSHSATKEAVALLNCSLDKKVQIVTSLKAENSTVVGDLSQLQNVFINLGINAGHAMPDGGTLTIDSSNTYLDRITADAYGVEPGDYIRFDIRDTGCGISPENLTKIFEPFFTTKEPGKGTGLGLAAAFGIVRQHKGSITVYSEQGVGTVFHILLPITEKKRTEAVYLPPVKGEGLILVVDDEQIIRTTAAAILKQLGYEVLLAENGQKGVEVYNLHKDLIKLVILDMIMPVMNGRECFEQIRKVNPNAKVILASGFAKEEDLHQMKQHGLCGFIHKPYSVSELSQLLQKHLSLKK